LDGKTSVLREQPVKDTLPEVFDLSNSEVEPEPPVASPGLEDPVRHGQRQSSGEPIETKENVATKPSMKSDPEQQINTSHRNTETKERISMDQNEHIPSDSKMVGRITWYTEYVVTICR
jgi:hypothetical protein